jgi:hypothetical protein
MSFSPRAGEVALARAEARFDQQIGILILTAQRLVWCPEGNAPCDEVD